MGFGFCGFDCGCERERRERERCEREKREMERRHREQQGNANLIQFLRTLSPGTCVVLQYDCQPPAIGTFQGFQNNTVILSNFDCFPGLAHIAANKVNAVSVSSPECHRRHHHKDECCESERF